MKSNILTDYYNPLMAQHNFYPVGCPDKFGPAGQCWALFGVTAQPCSVSLSLADASAAENAALSAEASFASTATPRSLSVA